MKEIDPGHIYRLQVLDGEPGETAELVFVKREGEKFPGNVGHHPGTIIQEVLRAVLARLAYVDEQEPDFQNRIVTANLELSIKLLEARAAKRHGRNPPDQDQALWGQTCAKCGHVGCQGGCK